MKVTKATTKPPFKPEHVDVRNVLVEDLINAEQATGKSQGYAFLCGVISQAAVFDGQAVPPEEVKRLTMADFLTLTDELGLNGQAISRDTSSTSSEKGSSESPES